MDLDSGVCESREITVAALFPIPTDYPQDGRNETWIYVAYNDSKLFRTYKEQQKSARNAATAAILQGPTQKGAQLEANITSARKSLTEPRGQGVTE